MICGRRVGLVLSLGLGVVAVAQQGRMYTASDYAQAEKMLAVKTGPLVYHAVTRVEWMKDGRFWYRDVDATGGHYFVMDAAGKKSPAFDEAKIIAGLKTAGGPTAQAGKLMVTSLEYSDDGSKVTIGTGGRTYTCGMSDGVCVAAAGGGGGRGAGGRGARGAGAAAAAPRVPENLSPDGSKAAYIENWNLWVRDVKTGEKKQLTTDGVENYGYSTDNAGWKHSDNAIVTWSADSTKIATFQQDQRKTGDMYLVTTEVGHPKLMAWKYPLAGDKDVTMIERVMIDVPTGKMTRVKMGPDQHRSTNCDDVACRGGGWDDVQWSDDKKTLAFVSTDRGHKSATLMVADAETGEVKTIFKETAKTQFQSGINRVNWHYLPKSNEFLWWSQRDNWGHMYLYDLKTGQLKSQITKGDWNVAQVLKIDEEKREFYFVGVGKEKGDPYYQYFYKVGFDGKGLTLLTPGGEFDHAVTLAKDGKTFVDVYSTPVVPQTTVLRSMADGKVIGEVAKADITALKASGWVPLTQITVKARDGKTDLYGYMFKPSKNFDTSKKYPVVNYVYPGPQTGSCGSRAFTASRNDNQGLAELGFIVVCIDGMGTPWRSKAFQDFYYGHMIDNTLPDQVAGMKDLAKQYPFIDLDRVGMWGHSGGGNATADAMFTYPDFIKVGISESGNHDNLLYEDDWGERYAGLVTPLPDGTTSYTKESNYPIAKNLKGKLMLAFGSIDDNVPPYETLELVDTLIKDNKSFDLVVLPNIHHGYAQDGPYMMRRRWDYFVTNLMKGVAPENYQIATE